MEVKAKTPQLMARDLDAWVTFLEFNYFKNYRSLEDINIEKADQFVLWPDITNDKRFFIIGVDQAYRTVQGPYHIEFNSSTSTILIEKTDKTGWVTISLRSLQSLCLQGGDVQGGGHRRRSRRRSRKANKAHTPQ